MRAPVLAPVLAGLAAALALALALGPAPALAEDAPLRPVLTATGTGTAEAAPDLAVLRLGVETRAETAADALAQTREVAARIIAALEAEGVAAGDIATASFSVRPLAGSSGSEGLGGDGFAVSNQVIAEIRRLDAVGAVIDAAVAAGANRVDGLGFALADTTALAEAALAAAVADATRTARAAAAGAGLGLGPVISITSGGGVQPIRGQVAALSRSATPIEPGAVSLSRSVTMVWALDPGE